MLEHKISLTTLTQQLKYYLDILQETVRYFTKLRVIFYSELALIMFCIADFTFYLTQLGIVLKISVKNYAFSHAAMSRSVLLSHMNYGIWSEVFLVLLLLYLLESVVRIYYIMKLAYYHNQKVKDGDLCCINCHQALLSAAMTTEVSAPHILSAISLIVFLIYSKVNIAAQTTQLYKDYFRESPFIDIKDIEVLGHKLEESTYYEMGKHVIEVLNDCRINASQMSVDDSVHRLLLTGHLLGVVKYDCSRLALHCKYSSFYLQLSIESVQSLINYTVIRGLFGHVIRLHQYEVYNQQTRLQTSGGTRLIQVYKVRHTMGQKSRRSVMELPRRALMSLVSLGTNMASRFRSSREVHRQQLHEEPKDTPFLSLTENNVEEQALLTASAESCPTDKFQTPQAASKSSDGGKGHGQGPQLYNRKTAANPRKVNYEHVKVSELYPGSLETVDEQQTTDGKPSAPRQAPAGPQGAPDPAPIRQTQQPQKQQDSATNSTEQQQKQLVNNKPEDEKRSDLDQPLTEKDILPALQKDGLMSTTATICRKLKAKRINDSIFTDETFYSLEST